MLCSSPRNQQHYVRQLLGERQDCPCTRFASHRLAAIPAPALGALPSEETCFAQKRVSCHGATTGPRIAELVEVTGLGSHLSGLPDLQQVSCTDDVTVTCRAQRRQSAGLGS